MLWLADSYESIYRRAQWLSQVGDYQGAVVELRRMVQRLMNLPPSALERRPTLQSLLFDTAQQLTTLLADQGQHDEAIHITEQLAEKDPLNREMFRRRIGSLHIDKGEVEEGLNFLRALAEERPEEALNWMALGQQAGSLGRREEALEYLDKAVETARRRNERALAWLTIASLRREAQEYDEAALAWEKAFEADQETAPGPQWAYHMYMEAKDFGKAREYLAREENKFLSNFYAGWISWKEGNLAGARRVWRMVASWEPGKHLGELQCWGEACLRAGQVDKIPPVFTKYLEEQQGTVGVLFLLGAARAAMGEMEAAEALFENIAGLLRSARQPEPKLDAERWELLDTAIENQDTKSRLRKYFAVAQTEAPAQQPG